MRRFCRNNCLGMGLLFLLCLSLFGCRQANQLSLRLKKGAAYAQRVHLVSDLKMPPFPGADYHDSQMVLKYEVIEVDEQGSATIRVTIDSILASMKSLTVSASFDSSKEESDAAAGRTADIKQRFRQCFLGLKGAGYSALLDQKGQVVKVFDVDQAIERIAAGPILDETAGGYQVAHLLSPSHLREYVALGMYAAWLDARPQPDQNWLSYEPVETPRAAPVMAQKTFKLDNIKNEKNQRLAVVSFQTGGAPDRPLPPYALLTGKRTRAEVEIKAIAAGEGEIIFSLSQGRLVKLREKLTAEVIFPGIDPPPGASATDRPQRKVYYVVDKTIEYLDK